MFIFVRCLRSSAATTPAKYKLDIIQATTVLIIRKNWENNGTEKIGLVTPTPDHVYNKPTNRFLRARLIIFYEKKWTMI